MTESPGFRWTAALSRAVGAAMIVGGVLPAAALAAEVSYDRDVMAVLSKAGCNLGACHANANGKGGFKLSLRGEDPAADYAALVREADQRRVNRLEPDSSLILQKPTGQVVHQGGLRFSRDSNEYRILRSWIAAGAPGPDPRLPQPIGLEVTPAEAVLREPAAAVQLSAVALFADGTRRDITSLACYEVSNQVAAIRPEGLAVREQYGETTVIVRYLNQHLALRVAFLPARPDFAWKPPATQNYIDDLVLAKLQALDTNPSAICDDSTFIRRAMLDATGVLPTADEAREFVADNSPDKRQRLIDRIVHRPEFAAYWALKWSDVLRNEEKVLDRQGVDAFHAWIRGWIAQGKPMDAFVRELVTASGSTYDVPAANFYRANRDPLTRGETAARLFLGVRLQCARCHNHPYDRWTQDDYYSWAAIFSQVDYQIVRNKRRDRLDKHEFNGEQVVLLNPGAQLANARTGRDAPPQFLGGYRPPQHPLDDRRVPLAAWLTSPANHLFVESQVNFVWYHLLGRGIVEPIDDFRITNPPSNPALLRALARDYARDFDLRRLVRTIMASAAYQLAAEPNETNLHDEANFSRATVRRLPAEVLLDAQFAVLGTTAEFSGYPAGTRAGEVRGTIRASSRDKSPASADRFLMAFGKPERLLACECERSNETTLKQAFTLIGGEGLNQLLTDGDNRLAEWADSDMAADEIVRELYWTALSRPPTPEELAGGQSLLFAADDDRFTALQDLAWALLNSKEFVFRH